MPYSSIPGSLFVTGKEKKNEWGWGRGSCGEGGGNEVGGVELQERTHTSSHSQHLEQPASYIACPAVAEVRIVAELPTQTACSRQASSTTPWTLD